jgi:hypothetical protein
MGTALIDPLSDRSVLLSLQELTEVIDPAVDADRAGAADLDEARELVAALLEAGGVPTDAIAAGTREAATGAGRRLLEHALADPDTAAAAREILADPPQDDQLSVETAIAAAVVFGALVAWLQTKVDIKISRKDGKTEFEFRATKSATPPATLERLARLIAGFFGEQNAR